MLETLFAFDCGSTNWRLYRATYSIDGPTVTLQGDPQPAPLTSFVNRRLPAIVLLTSDGTKLESFGDVAQQQMEDEALRDRVRDHFKPCIGAHLLQDPSPQQKRYTHAEALHFTGLLLEAVLHQLRQEKWRASPFDERIRFAFAYPVHWRDDYEGQILEAFQQTVLECLPAEIHDQVRFVPEPEGALLSLQRQGLLGTPAGTGATLVVDVGGSTTDLVAGWVDPSSGELERVRRYGEPHGGGLYDAELAKYIADTLRIPASALADDPSAMIALRTSARQLKEALSRMLLHPGDSSFTPQRTVTLVMRNGDIFRRAVKLDEATFLEIARHLIVDFEYLVENGLKAMDLAEDEIGQVVLVGGGSQTFTIARHLRARFGESKVVLADNPAEAVVRGVALEYGHALAPPTPAPTEEAVAPESPWRLRSQDGQLFVLQMPTTTLGRKRTNAVWLKDDQVSRFHAELRHTEQGWAIVDLDSSNGTRLNGVRIDSETPHPLQPGDEIKLGGTTLTLEER